MSNPFDSLLWFEFALTNTKIIKWIFEESNQILESILISYIPYKRKECVRYTKSGSRIVYSENVYIFHENKINIY